jgi:hypothetical protein
LAEDQKLDQESYTKEYLRFMKSNNLTKCIQDWVNWKEVVEKAKTFKL